MEHTEHLKMMSKIMGEMKMMMSKMEEVMQLMMPSASEEMSKEEYLGKSDEEREAHDMKKMVTSE